MIDADSLISLVASKPAVWDRRDRQHHNRYVVDQCWRDISAEMNDDENKLRKKWKYLRDQFSVEYGKMLASRLDDEDPGSEVKWPYYQSLMFLKDVVKPRNVESFKRTSRNPSNAPKYHAKYFVDAQYESSDTQDDSTNDQSDALDTKDNVRDMLDLSHDFQDNSCDLPDKHNPIGDLDTIGVQRDASRKRRTKTFSDETSLETRKRCLLKQKAEDKYQEEDDEHLHFFKSLLPHVRKIPHHRLLSFRNSVQDTVERFAYQ